MICFCYILRNHGNRKRKQTRALLNELLPPVLFIRSFKQNHTKLRKEVKMSSHICFEKVIATFQVYPCLKSNSTVMYCHFEVIKPLN